MEGERQSQPVKCVNGCGFFGYVLLKRKIKFASIRFKNISHRFDEFSLSNFLRNPTTENYCSKCYRERQQTQKQDTQKKDEVPSGKNALSFL